MSKRLLSALTHPFSLTIILFLLQLGLFTWITLRPFSISPPGRAYYVLRGQGAYTALIRQSKEGAWNIYNPSTTRPSPAVYVQLLYIFLGKIAGVFSFDPIATYMVTRVIGGLILFLATYWFIVTILPPNFQSLAVVFTLGLEPGPLLSTIHDLRSLLTAPPAIFSYFPQELALRHFGLPHHVLGEALGLLLLGHVFLFVKKPSWLRLAGIALLTIFGAVIMPAYNCVLLLTVFTAWFVWALMKGQNKKIVPALLTIVVCLGAAGLFTKLQMDSGYPWKNFNLDEKRWVTDPFLLTNYLSSLLLYIPAALILWVSLPHVWRRMSATVQLLTVLTTTWVVGPILYIPFTHLRIFPLANFRLVDGYAYVPAGILTAMGIREVARAGGKRTMALTVALMLTASFFLTASFTRQTFAEQHNIWANVYPLRQEWDAIRFLSTTPKRSGIMVMKYLGEIIPAYATVRVFLGETPGAIDWDERYYEAIRFYGGQLTDIQAKDLLRREDISYVWWGQDEKEFMKTPALYPNVLAPVFQNPAVTIFEQKQ